MPPPSSSGAPDGAPLLPSGSALTGWAVVWPGGRLAGAVVVVTAIVVLETRVARAGGVGPGRYRLLALILLWWVLTGLATWLLVNAAPRRLALAVIFAGLLALQVAALTRGTQISDDMYRYAWDGRVQAAGIDPYRYPPVDPQLHRLRAAWLWPDGATCQRDRLHSPTCTRVNRPGVRTIYPPVAEAWFTLLVALPGGFREHHLQLWTDVLALGLVVLLVRLLPRYGVDPRWAALLALSPLCGLDLASDAHVDVLAVVLAVSGLHLLRRHRPGWSGALLGAAVAVKLYPILLFPAALRRRPAAVAGAAAFVVAASYVPHVLVVGPRVLGYLPGYLHEEHYASGGRFLLLSGLGVPTWAAGILAAAGLAAVAMVVVRADPVRLPPERAAVWLVGAAFLLTSPVQPWYAVLLVGLGLLAGRPEWTAVAVAAYPTYFTALLAHAPARLVGSLSYGAAGAFVLVTGLLRSARRGDRFANRKTAAAP